MILTEREMEVAAVVFQWALQAVAETSEHMQASAAVVQDAILSDPTWRERLKAKLEKLHAKQLAVLSGL